MADANAQLDQPTKDAIVKFIKQRLGLLGALSFKHHVEECTCYPCRAIWGELTAGIMPDPPVA